MVNYKRWLCLTIIIASSCRLQAQDVDSLFLFPKDSSLSYTDSLNIFYLIDSLLTLDASMPGSLLAARLGYNSNVLSAGRTLGIEQFGLSPGISYYHGSGLYADFTAYWSNDFDPKFYLTILSLGYMHTFSKTFSLNAGYDRYFTINNDFLVYKNTFSVTPYIDLKPITISLNYSYYFGESDAHRLMPSLGLNLAKKKLFKIQKITFSPSVNLLLGNQEFIEVEVVYPKTLLERLQNLKKYGTPYKVLATARNEFGVMNYAFSFPLSVSHKKWNFYINYTYSIPKALPSETLLLSKSHFISGGITYYISLKRDASDW